MAFNTITSANATFLLSIASIYPTGVPLIGFAVDDAFVAEMADAAETRVGVDGYGVMGYRPREVPMSIKLLPSSVSIVVFENWIAAEDQLNDKLPASAIITMRSVARKYACALGALTRVSSMAEARRMLADREWRINWLPQGPGQPAISASPM
ncbi:MAG TPA: hypothetical protein VFG00_13330 [Acidothermaceae bacterium]|nr:hypothetical protein [Acidothermaceae bacterium]